MNSRMSAMLLVVAASFAPANADVDFVKDVRPILEFNCLRCHSPKASAVVKGDTDVELDTRAKTVRGSVVVPGVPLKSTAYTTTLLEDGDPKVMPPAEKGKWRKRIGLTEPEQAILKAWINEGAKCPDG